MGTPGALSGAPPGTRRRKLAVAAASSFAALLAAEVAARKLFGVPLEERLPIVEVQANPTRGYEMVPDRDHYTYLHPVHVNHLGLRGPDLPEKAPGECRILCLGDSLVYGQGVADPDTIPAALEAELSGRAGEAHRIVRVVNGGVRGYDTAQERALLEELGDRIRPDVVVLFWYPNDLEKPRIEAARESLARSGPVAYDTDRRMEGTALWTWRGRQILRRSALVVRLRHVWADLADRPLPPEEVERGLRRLDQDLGRIQAWASERGVVCVVVALPESVALSESAAGLEERHAADLVRERVREIARGHELPSVDPTPELRVLAKELGAPPILPYDGHYDGRANRAIARRLAPVLQELLPTRL